MRASLEELAALHGTDKARSGLSRIYEPFVAPIRDEPVNVLEIGVLEGASLRMWQDFFPNGQIVGLDLNERAADHATDRITVIVGDQTEAAIMDRAIAAGGPFDLVVDDGGHWAHQQIRSLMYLWPHVKPGRLYIVEDTHTSYMSQYDMSYRNPASVIELLKGAVDDLHATWHTHPETLENLASIHFFDKTCVLRKQDTLRARNIWRGIGKKSMSF